MAKLPVLTLPASSGEFPSREGQSQLALQAKLARLETLSGHERKTELHSFADEARQRGYLLLARKALAAAGT